MIGQAVDYVFPPQPSEEVFEDAESYAKAILETDRKARGRSPVPVDTRSSVVLWCDRRSLGMAPDCLRMLIATVDLGRVTIRLATPSDNAAWTEGVPETVVLADIRRVEQESKLDVMRSLVADFLHEDSAEWFLWLDSSTRIIHMDWLSLLFDRVEASEREGVSPDVLGAKLSHRITEDDPEQALKWLKTRPWYRGKYLRNGQGRESPNGDRIHYPHAGFVAIHRECLAEGLLDDIDSRRPFLSIGEKVHQLDRAFRAFDVGRSALVLYHDLCGDSKSPYPWRGETQWPGASE